MLSSVVGWQHRSGGWFCFWESQDHGPLWLFVNPKHYCKLLISTNFTVRHDNNFVSLFRIVKNQNQYCSQHIRLYFTASQLRCLFFSRVCIAKLLTVGCIPCYRWWMDSLKIFDLGVSQVSNNNIGMIWFDLHICSDKIAFYWMQPPSSIRLQCGECKQCPADIRICSFSDTPVSNAPLSHHQKYTYIYIYRVYIYRIFFQDEFYLSSYQYSKIDLFEKAFF